jgi:hypothetical protein
MHRKEGIATTRMQLTAAAGTTGRLASQAAWSRNRIITAGATQKIIISSN